MIGMVYIIILYVYYCRIVFSNMYIPVGKSSVKNMFVNENGVCIRNFNYKTKILRRSSDIIMLTNSHITRKKQTIY